MAQTPEQIAENRRRYEELRAAGQELTPKGLPERTALDGAPIAPDAVIHREIGAVRLVHDLAPAPGRSVADHR